MEKRGRKRATMMVDSDEDEDLFSEKLEAIPKKKKSCTIQDLASGPQDFIEALTGAGFHPRTENLPNLLSVHQSDFQQQLRDHFFSSIHYPRNIEFFIAECDLFFDIQHNFIKALQPTENSCESSSVFVLPQDSLVRLLLNIDEVQPKLIESILKRFAKVVKEERSSAEVNLPSLILSQLAWLNRFVDPTSLIDKMLDILHSSPTTIQREIILQLPGLVSDKEQIRVAFDLSDMLNDNNALTAAILDALGDLNLPAIEAAELRARVIKRLSSVPLETIPVLLTFVLKRVTAEETGFLIKEIRKNLDKALKGAVPNVSQRKNTNNNCISLSVESLQNSLVRSKALADTWFRAIQSVSEAKEHYCVDFIILIIEHKLTGRRKNVETLLKKKMRCEQLTGELLKETFHLYWCILKDFFDQLRAMADSLLLTKDPLIIPYGSLFYTEMFQRFEEYYQQEVVEALIQHICCAGETTSSADSPATASVVALQQLADTCWCDLVRLSAYIVTLLEYLDYMSLPQVKRIMELLAKMAYGFSPDDNSRTRWASFSASIQSELMMIIRKQLCHTRIEFQRMGVIGSVALVHSLADPELVGDTNQEMQLNETVSSIAFSSASSDILTGAERLRQAKKVIDLVHGCTKRVPEVAALFMDEMASSLLFHDLHPTLQSYLYETVVESFQDKFVVDEDEQNIDNLEIAMSLQFGLDKVDENSNVKMVFMNLGPMVVAEKGRKAGEQTRQSTVTTLMSHFRLLRNTIESFGEANLEDIDALLGCAICIPSEAVMDDFEMNSQSEKDMICRCIFYTINWFIEVINTFARSKPMRFKVLQRLRDVVDLKEKFFRCLSKNPSFTPPPAVFCGDPVRSRNSTSTAPKRGKKPSTSSKKGKAKQMKPTQSSQKSILHSTPMEVSHAAHTKLNFTLSQREGDSCEIPITDYDIQFREVDFSSFILLSSPLDLVDTNDPSTVSLRPKELELLLEDLANKLEHKLLTSSVKRKLPAHIGQEKKEFNTLLDLYPCVEVAKRCVVLIKRLCLHLETISGHFQQLIQLNDGMMDTPEMFNDLAQRLGSCYHLILRILNRICSWHQFQKTEQKPLYEDALKYLGSRIQAELKAVPLCQLNETAFTYIEKFADSLPNFACAVEHVHLLNTLLSHMPDPQLSARLALVAEGFLKRNWLIAEGGSDKGPKFNQGVESILKVYLTHGTDVFGKLEHISMVAMKEVLESNTKDGVSESLQTFNKNTLAVYFRALFTTLVDCIKEIPSSPDVDVSASLKSWASCIGLLNILVSAVKSVAKRTILSTCLKYGRMCVELFSKQAMPLLDKQFKHFRADCQNLLKNLQSSTRTLQHVCTHAKTSRDANLAVYVPAMKKTLESLLYRVKAMLAANGCVGAFWLGNLKNKNLQGEEILSQSQESHSEESDDETAAVSDEESDAADVDVTAADPVTGAASGEETEELSVSPDY